MWEQGIAEYDALCALKVGVSWDGRHVVAPPGVLDQDGIVDLTQAKRD